MPNAQGTPVEPEPFEALGAPPVVSLESIAQALSPAVGASFARHPDARPGFIGMHLLARLEGSAPPDTPPVPPQSSSDMRSELRNLEGILSEALNHVRGQGSRDSILARLAVRLIDRMDEGRRARYRRYSDPQAIWDQVESGDVVLLRASWLLERAGYRPVAHGGSSTDDKQRGVSAWAPRAPPLPLPRRQELERDFPEAIMPLAELKQHHRSFVHVAREAQSVAYGAAHATSALDEGVEAMPVVSVSHCWETPEHPDPQGRSLRIVAAELADGGWDAFDERGMPAGAPTCGLPLYRAWGFDDIGVFWDWCSLHQAPRSESESAAFRRAFARQDVYFAHTLTTAYILQAQPAAHLRVPRGARGWPYYEEAVAMMLKRSPPLHAYELPYHPSISPVLGVDVPLIAPCWAKVVAVSRADGGPEYSHALLSKTKKRAPKEAMEPELPEVSLIASREERLEAAKARALAVHRQVDAKRDLKEAIRQEAAALVRSARAKPPPLSPSRFAAVLRSKAFANGGDCGAIAGLYRAVLEDGVGGLQQLRLAACGWGDADVEHLAQTLNEVRASELTELDLSENVAWVDGEALSQAFEGRRIGGLVTKVPLLALKVLTLKRCTALRSLPTSLGRLVALETLDCAGCESLLSLPPTTTKLAALSTLILSDCFALAALPHDFARLSALRHLNLDYCDCLCQLPDMSGMEGLHVELLPSRLAAWEAGGRRAFDFMESGPPLEAHTVDLSFLGTRTLPRWLERLTNVTALNLTGCDGLEDLTMLRSLTRLRMLRLCGCRQLVSLDEANLGAFSDLQHLDLSGCVGLSSLPDLSALESCEVVGLSDKLQQWDLRGRKAWIYDPDAPLLPVQPPLPSYHELNAGRPIEDAQETMAEGGSSSTAVDGSDDGGVLAAQALAASAEQPAALQRLILSSMDWGDNELFKVAEALRTGESINGFVVDPDRLGTLDLACNMPMRSGNVLGHVLQQLSVLECLNLSSCSGLQSLPDNIGCWRLAATLTELDLSDCSSMVSLPESICDLSRLVSLSLGSALKSLPHNFGQLSELRILRAVNLCSIQHLPVTFGRLSALEELDMRGMSSLVDFPDGYFGLTQLRALSVGGRSAAAPLKSLPEDVGRLTSLRMLDLGAWGGLRTLPDSLCHLSALESLELTDCVNLEALPSCVGDLCSLEVLGLWNCNKLASLPDSVGDMVALRDLDLTGTQLEALPECVGRLPNLKCLNLCDCSKLVRLCDALPLSLEKLTLNSCFALQSVPESLGALTKLTSLECGGCGELQVLPDMSRLTELTYLCLVGCGGLEAMPEGLNRLEGCLVKFDDGDVIIG